MQTGLCPYRWGQATAIVAPIVFTAGSWAVIKAGDWAGRLSAIFGNKADDVAKLIAEAEKLGYTIAREDGKVIIRNGDEVTTIAKNGDELVVSVGKGGSKVLYSVDKSFQAGDEAVEVFQNGVYRKNPTATTIDELTINPSGTVKGKKWLQKEQTTEELLNGAEYMYVIDENDRLIIGTRAQHTDFSKPTGKAPHPTLISGADPKVQAAGTVEFRGGKIYKIDNASGHYKPSAESLKKTEEIFRKDFPANSFDNNFQGFMQYGN
jgi:hypothetical protein